MEMEEEPYSELEPIADLLAHVPVADSERLAPGTGCYNYPGFFGTLHYIGYHGRIAAENTWRDVPAEGAPRSLSCATNGRLRLLRRQGGNLLELGGVEADFGGGGQFV